MTGPSTATIKRLFAVSNNECAFPACTQRLVEGEALLGEICHIRGANGGAKRYDSGQCDAERHAFANLILLCPTHHTKIDNDNSTYSVDRLLKMKAEHEAKSHKEFEVNDAIVNRLTNISIASLAGAIAGSIAGPVINSFFQSGGQIAHTINNYGPPRRTVTQEMRGRMLDRLRTVPPSRIGFASTQGDQEAHGFKHQLIEVFRAAGWTVEDAETFMFFGSKTGLVVTIPFGAPEVGVPQVVAEALSQTGNPTAGNRGDMANSYGIYVQVWHIPQ